MISLSHNKLELDKDAPNDVQYDLIPRDNKTWYILDSAPTDMSKPPRFTFCKAGKVVAVPMFNLRLPPDTDMAFAAAFLMGLAAGAGAGKTLERVHIATTATTNITEAGIMLRLGVAFTEAAPQEETSAAEAT